MPGEKIAIESFLWLISEYRRTFLAVVLIFGLFPFGWLIWQEAKSSGHVDSPVMYALQAIEEQHVKQLAADVIKTQAIQLNQAKLKENGELMQRVIRNDERAFRLGVADCFNNAALANGPQQRKEGRERCEKLQILE